MKLSAICGKVRPVTTRERVKVSLPAAIRQARAERGWSQVRLASEVATTERTVKRWESGQAVPTGKVRLRLVSLGVPSGLFERSETAGEVERRLRAVEGEIVKLRALLERS